MASAIALDSKRYYKMPAPNPYVGYKQYKDYKVLWFQCAMTVDEGDIGVQVFPVAQHVFENDGIIRMVYICSTILMMKVTNTIGGTAHGYLRFNEAYPLFSARCTAKVYEGGLLTDLMTPMARSENVVYPDLWTPVMEQDKLELVLEYADYTTPPAAVGATEDTITVLLHFIDK